MYCSLLNFESDNSIILKLHGLILNYIFLVISIYQSENATYLLHLARYKHHCVVKQYE